MPVGQRGLGGTRLFRLAHAKGNATQIKGAGNSQIPNNRHEHLKGQRQREQEDVKPAAAHRGSKEVTAFCNVSP